MSELTAQDREALERLIGKEPMSGDLRADYNRLAWAWQHGVAYVRKELDVASFRVDNAEDPVVRGPGWKDEHLRPRPGELERYIEMARAEQHEGERLRAELAARESSKDQEATDV